MGADKIASAVATGAEVLCGADNSCLAHLDGLLRRADAPPDAPPDVPPDAAPRTAPRTLHLAEILAATEEEGPLP